MQVSILNTYIILYYFNKSKKYTSNSNRSQLFHDNKFDNVLL